jgi:hypothetical protein
LSVFKFWRSVKTISLLITKFENDLYGNAKKNPKAIRSYITSKSKTREGIGDLDIDPDANPE